MLPQSDTEAYLWAKRAANMGLPKAEYAMGYFTEVRQTIRIWIELMSHQSGIGTHKDIQEAQTWYQRAEEHGDKRAPARLAAFAAQQANIPNGQTQRPEVSSASLVI